MPKRIRDIIIPQMTTLRFMYSKAAAEAYFQRVCYSAHALSFTWDMEIHHPYSFDKMVSFIQDTMKTMSSNLIK